MSKKKKKKEPSIVEQLETAMEEALGQRRPRIDKNADGQVYLLRPPHGKQEIHVGQMRQCGCGQMKAITFPSAQALAQVALALSHFAEIWDHHGKLDDNSDKDMDAVIRSLLANHS